MEWNAYISNSDAKSVLTGKPFASHTFNVWDSAMSPEAIITCISNVLARVSLICTQVLSSTRDSIRYFLRAKMTTLKIEHSVLKMKKEEKGPSGFGSLKRKDCLKGHGKTQLLQKSGYRF